MSRLLTVLALAILTVPGPIRAQEADPPLPVPADTFQDERARRLVMDHLQRHADFFTEGETLQAELDNRVRVGLFVPNQWNWRARTLFRKEVAAHIQVRDSRISEGEIFDRQRGAPIIGDRLLDNDPLWNFFGFDPEDDRPALLGVLGLSLASVGADVPTDQATGQILAFDETFADPLGLDGPTHYTYRTGPTLEDPEAPGRLLESVEFFSRPEMDLDVVGVAWFDPLSGEPVRMMLHPRERWQLNAGLRGFIRKIPLLPRDAEGEVTYIAIDYRDDGRGVVRPAVAWIRGTMFWFWSQVILPVEIEWDLDWHRAKSESDRTAPPPLEGGWSFSESRSIDRRQLGPYLQQLDEVSGIPPREPVLKAVFSAVSSVRFNQVQGVNFAIRYPLALSPTWSIEPRLEIPTSGFQPTGSLTLRNARTPVEIGLSGYSRLRDANWMEPVNSVTGSLTAILTGFDDGNYYLADGGGVFVAVENRPLVFRLEAFGEYQTNVEKTATYSLFDPDSTKVGAPSIETDEGSYFGLRGNLNLQLGDDAQQGVLVARAYGTLATGAAAYATLGTTTDVVGPLFGPLAGAFRGTFNLGMGNVPNQALFYLGGTRTIRGYPPASRSGPSALIGTFELATAIPLVRLVAFSDVAWAGEVNEMLDDKALISVGGGLSFLDGSFRIDVARSMTDEKGWRLHIGSSAVF